MSQVEFFDSIAKEWDAIIEVNEEKINTILSKINIKDNNSIHVRDILSICQYFVKILT
jgi:demethylmenaquinone methyltransferase/2-methoxy-6-polyprenyl-1,4-benzoquinol methylase